ncbi:MAG: hypothetical protein M3P98_02460 [bacterium]|nr:hypothetical protein [bacterium]
MKLIKVKGANMASLSTVKKATIVGSIALVVVIGGWLIYNVLNPTYSISGKFIDSDNGKPVQGVAIKGGDKDFKSTADGRYEISKVSKNTFIEIKAPEGYEPANADISYDTAQKTSWRTKEINEDYTLQITEKEKESRLLSDITDIYNAFKFERWDDVYAAMHPDSKERISQADYVAEMKKNFEGVSITDFSIENPKFLEKWTFDVNKKEYTDAASADVSLKVQMLGAEQTVNQSAHFAKEGNEWRWFFSADI